MKKIYGKLLLGSICLQFASASFAAPPAMDGDWIITQPPVKGRQVFQTPSAKIKLKNYYAIIDDIDPNSGYCRIKVFDPRKINKLIETVETDKNGKTIATTSEMNLPKGKSLIKPEQGKQIQEQLQSIKENTGIDPSMIKSNDTFISVDASSSGTLNSDTGTLITENHEVIPNTNEEQVTLTTIEDSNELAQGSGELFTQTGELTPFGEEISALSGLTEGAMLDAGGASIAELAPVPEAATLTEDLAIMAGEGAATKSLKVAVGLSAVDLLGPIAMTAQVVRLGVKVGKMIAKRVHGDYSSIVQLAVNNTITGQTFIVAGRAKGSGTNGTSSNASNDLFEYWDGTCWTNPGAAHCDSTSGVTNWDPDDAQIIGMKVLWTSTQPQIIAVTQYSVRYFDGNSWSILWNTADLPHDKTYGNQVQILASDQNITGDGPQVLIMDEYGSIYYITKQQGVIQLYKGVGAPIDFGNWIDQGTIYSKTMLYANWPISAQSQTPLFIASLPYPEPYYNNNNIFFYNGKMNPLAKDYNLQAISVRFHGLSMPEIVKLSAWHPTNSTDQSDVQYYNGTSWLDLTHDQYLYVYATNLMTNWSGQDYTPPTQVAISGSVSNGNTSRGRSQVYLLNTTQSNPAWSGTWSNLANTTFDGTSSFSGSSANYPFEDGTSDWTNISQLAVEWPDSASSVNPTIVAAGGGNYYQLFMNLGSNQLGQWNALDNVTDTTSDGNIGRRNTGFANSGSDLYTSALSVQNSNSMVLGDTQGNVRVYKSGMWIDLTNLSMTNPDGNNKFITPDKKDADGNWVGVRGGFVLKNGYSIRVSASDKSGYTTMMTMQGDNNLVIYECLDYFCITGYAIGATGTNGKGIPGTARASFQGDGNLVVVDAANNVLWDAFTAGKTANPAGTAYYELTLSGELKAYTGTDDDFSNSSLLWSFMKNELNSSGIASETKNGYLPVELTQSGSTLIPYKMITDSVTGTVTLQYSAPATLTNGGVIRALKTNGEGYAIYMQPDNNLLEYYCAPTYNDNLPCTYGHFAGATGTAIGENVSGAAGSGYLIMQRDGNLVLYTSAGAKWSSCQSYQNQKNQDYCYNHNLSDNYFYFTFDSNGKIGIAPSINWSNPTWWLNPLSYSGKL